MIYDPESCPWEELAAGSTQDAPVEAEARAAIQALDADRVDRIDDNRKASAGRGARVFGHRNFQ